MNDKLIKNNIIILKNSTGLSGKHFSEKLGLHPEFYRNLTNRNGGVKLEVIKKICDYYNFSIDDFTSKKVIVTLSFEN